MIRKRSFKEKLLFYIYDSWHNLVTGARFSSPFLFDNSRKITISDHYNDRSTILKDRAHFFFLNRISIDDKKRILSFSLSFSPIDHHPSPVNERTGFVRSVPRESVKASGSSFLDEPTDNDSYACHPLRYSRQPPGRNGWKGGGGLL